MFESSRRLREDIDGLLEAVRQRVDGHYACVMEPGRILAETGELEPAAPLRALLEANGPAIFALPSAMGTEPGPESDPFDGWEQDEVCLAVVNGKVAVLVACPDAESAREAMMPALKALVDRLLRLDGRYRLDEQGRGLFFGSPKVDFVVIGGVR